MTGSNAWGFLVFACIMDFAIIFGTVYWMRRKQ